MSADAKSILSALASEPRLLVLAWLKDPEAHFRPQREGDFVKDGVCGTRIAENLGLSLPTVSRHMKVLVDAGLVRAKRMKTWTFYQRNPAGITEARRLVRDVL